ncbi:MAG TPA: hypothetical protein VFH51_19360, partial [Myxococcota bacterium]|nr:hypothetical protein [Myxococcota bacterium]
MIRSIRYTLRFPSASQHYVDIEATFPGEAGGITLMLAVWTPGSYMLREYARHLEGVRAASFTGEALAVRKVAKNRWHVACDGDGDVAVSYRVYGRELTVRNNWIERDFAMLNGAPTFLTRVGSERTPHDVTVELPATWKSVYTAMPKHPDGGPCHYRAEDFDQLVDSPLLLGNAAAYPFEVGEKEHVLVNEGEGGVWDGPRSAADVAKLVQQNLKMWGALPYPRYVFLNVLCDGRGGLEHKDSSVMMASRWATRTRSDYVDWLGLISHEFFHVWNIKRLRPEALGPFDYEREVPTRSLWVAEGLTAYYDDLNVHRAGLSTQKEYLERLSKSIEQVQTTPGRRVQPLGDASFDAWIKHYRRDENTDNTAISYYIKGTVVGFLLDAKIRQATGNKKCLDDVMRLAFSRYAGARGYREEEFRAAAQEVAAAPLGSWFGTAVDSTEELDFTEALAWYGLQFKKPEAAKADGEAPPNKAGWLGISSRQEGGRLMVSEVVRDTPAYSAG